MDKFAVDIEKVLDEFEYNEGREESVAPVVIKNHTLSRINQKPLKPPAASYRRPTFEPINLADADFAAAPFPSTQSYTSTLKQNPFKETLKPLNNDIGHIETVIPSFKSKDDSKPDETYIKLEVTEGNTIQNTEVHEDSVENLPTEDTPDLLDTNILKPIQSHIYGDGDSSDSSNQLPDITSVRSTVSVNIHEIEPVFDLIKPHISSSVLNASLEEELPPVVDVGSVIKEEIPDLQIKPVAFDNIDDISEGELEDYLSNLEVEVTDSEEIISTSNEVIIHSEDGSDNQFNTQIVIDKSFLTNAEEVEVIMGLTGSSSKSEKPISISEQDDTKRLEFVDRTRPDQEFSKNETEKVSLLKDFPPETSYGNKKCELDNINCRSCTNNVSTDTLNVVEVVVESPKNLDESNDELSSAIKKEDKSSQLEQSAAADVKVPLKNNVAELLQHSTPNEIGLDDVTDPPTSPVESYHNASEITELTESPEQSSDTEGNAVYDSSTSVDENKPIRPNSLILASNAGGDSEEIPTPTNSGANNINSPLERLGKYPPFWVPDTETDNCMQCHNKFTVIRRRHHCRACGLVLCSKCCNLKAPLEYMEFMEARVCQPCFNIIYRVSLEDDRYNLGRQPNPNNPMEYCSTIPPLQQAASTINQPPPSVLVPTGVLKREVLNSISISSDYRFNYGPDDGILIPKTFAFNQKRANGDGVQH